jgi:NADH:ubiquinone oxidoreductase subunit E
MLTITICVGSSCYLRGSDELASALEGFIEKEALREELSLAGSFCMGECSTGISIKVGERQYREIRPVDAEPFFYAEILPRVRDKEAGCRKTG